MWQEAQAQIDSVQTTPPPPTQLAPPKKNLYRRRILIREDLKKTEGTTEGGKFLGSAGERFNGRTGQGSVSRLFATGFDRPRLSVGHDRSATRR